MQDVVIEKIVKAHPNAISAPDDACGRLPLHWACISGVSLSVLEFLVQSFPKACKVTDKLYGRLPLHYGAIHATSAAQITVLLQADKRAVAQKDSTSKTPLELAQESNNPIKLDIMAELRKKVVETKIKSTGKDHTKAHEVSREQWENPSDPFMSMGLDNHLPAAPIRNVAPSNIRSSLPIKPNFPTTAPQTTPVLVAQGDHSFSSINPDAPAGWDAPSYRSQSPGRQVMPHSPRSSGTGKGMTYSPLAPQDHGRAPATTSRTSGRARSPGLSLSNHAASTSGFTSDQIHGERTRHGSQPREDSNCRPLPLVQRRQQTWSQDAEEAGKSQRGGDNFHLSTNQDAFRNHAFDVPGSSQQYTAQPSYNNTTQTPPPLQQYQQKQAPVYGLDSRSGDYPHQFHAYGTSNSGSPKAPPPKTSNSRHSDDYAAAYARKMEEFTNKKPKAAPVAAAPASTYISAIEDSDQQGEMMGQQLLEVMNESIRELNEKLHRQKQNLEKKGSQLSDLDGRISQMNSQQESLGREVEAAHAHDRQKRDLFRQKQERITTLNLQIAKLQAELRQEQAELEDVERSMYVAQEAAVRSEAHLHAMRDEQGSLGAIRQALEDEMNILSRDVTNCESELKSLEAIQNLARGDSL